MVSEVGERDVPSRESSTGTVQVTGMILVEVEGVKT